VSESGAFIIPIMILPLLSPGLYGLIDATSYSNTSAGAAAAAFCDCA
jgi:hypothetical protein